MKKVDRKMPGGGKCVFNSDLITDARFKGWLRSVSSDKRLAYCKWCSKQFSVASMGVAALISHMASSKHKTRGKDASATSTIPLSFVSTCTQPDVPSTSSHDSSASSVDVEANRNRQAQTLTSLSPLCTSLSKKVADAEILWVIRMLV